VYKLGLIFIINLKRIQMLFIFNILTGKIIECTAVQAIEILKKENQEQEVQDVTKTIDSF
jgi:hypothetical protein